MNTVKQRETERHHTGCFQATSRAFKKMLVTVWIHRADKLRRLAGLSFHRWPAGSPDCTVHNALELCKRLFSSVQYKIAVKSQESSRLPIVDTHEICLFRRLLRKRACAQNVIKVFTGLDGGNAFLPPGPYLLFQSPASYFELWRQQHFFSCLLSTSTN